MLFIHGGGFVGGTGANTQYDGGNLASRGEIVVVTINYRLGPFGFLALNDTVTNGNYGIADQIVALDWVRANIAAFGGDLNRITIAGQSAGAISVRALLGSPQAVGKYAAALPISIVGGIGLYSQFNSYHSIAEGSIVVADPILRATNCTGAISQLDCLRKADAQTVSEASGTTFPFVPPSCDSTNYKSVTNGNDKASCQRW
jgi:carboxylesterase type B